MLKKMFLMFLIVFFGFYSSLFSEEGDIKEEVIDVGGGVVEAINILQTLTGKKEKDRESFRINQQTMGEENVDYVHLNIEKDDFGEVNISGFKIRMEIIGEVCASDFSINFDVKKIPKGTTVDITRVENVLEVLIKILPHSKKRIEMNIVGSSCGKKFGLRFQKTTVLF